MKIKQHEKGVALVEGIVVAREPPALALLSTSRNERYRIQYRFQTLAGEAVEGVETLDAAGRYAPGEEAEIAYVLSDPRSNHIHHPLERTHAIFDTAFAGLIAAAGGFFLLLLVVYWLFNWRTSRIFQELGVKKTKGTVTAITESNNQKMINFEFQDQLGRTRRGQHILMPEVANAFKVGDSGTVRFRPQDPENAYWIG